MRCSVHYLWFCFAEITKDSSGSVSGPDFSDSEVESGPSAISSTSNISGMMPSKQPASSSFAASPITPEQSYFVPVEIDPVTGRPKEPRTPIRPGRMNSGDAAIDTVESHDRANTAKFGRDADSRDAYRDQGLTDPDKPGHRGDQGGPGSRPDGAPKDSPDPRRDRSYPAEPGRFGGSSSTKDPSKHPGSRAYGEGYEGVDGAERKLRDDLPEADLMDYEDDGEGESLLDGSEMDYYDESTVRIFIALFDYEPMTQSPNPDAADEELPFKEGQLVKVRR